MKFLLPLAILILSLSSDGFAQLTNRRPVFVTGTRIGSPQARKMVIPHDAVSQRYTIKSPEECTVGFIVEEYTKGKCSQTGCDSLFLSSNPLILEAIIRENSARNSDLIFINPLSGLRFTHPLFAKEKEKIKIVLCDGIGSTVPNRIPIALAYSVVPGQDAIEEELKAKKVNGLLPSKDLSRLIAQMHTLPSLYFIVSISIYPL